MLGQLLTCWSTDILAGILIDNCLSVGTYVVVHLRTYWFTFQTPVPLALASKLGGGGGEGKASIGMAVMLPHNRISIAGQPGLKVIINTSTPTSTSTRFFTTFARLSKSYCPWKRTLRSSPPRDGNSWERFSTSGLARSVELLMAFISEWWNILKDRYVGRITDLPIEWLHDLLIGCLHSQLLLFRAMPWWMCRELH